MIYLYVKEHAITKLKYFGKTKRDPYKYKGSGIYWKQHLKKHGSHINTIKIWKFDNILEAKEFAINFSLENSIIDSDEWANLVLEDVTSGFIGKSHSDSTKAKMSAAKLNKPLSERHRQNIAKGNSGKTFSEERKKNISNAIKGKSHSEETKQKLRKKKGPQVKVECPHCKLIGGAAALKRYHFDNCVSL